MANWYRNPKDPTQAFNLEQVVWIETCCPGGDWWVRAWTLMDTPVDVAGPFESEGAALAVFTEIVGAVD